MIASKLRVLALEQEGIERIYGVPGEEDLDFLEAQRNPPIELILTRHAAEQADRADIGFNRLV